MDSDPPFLTAYKTLFHGRSLDVHRRESAPDECELPVIDLRRLIGDEHEAERCKRDIAAAASEWGFFQVVNHGVSSGLLSRLRAEQVNVFRRPFDKKATEKFLDFSQDSYRWGTPTATSLKQLSWSEAYHIPLTPATEPSRATTRHLIEDFSFEMLRLARRLLTTLAERLGYDARYINDNCKGDTGYLRMNRYPACPIPGEVFGLVPHTDSDFLTILQQDEVTGLQLMRNGRWLTVKPNPEALIINIGDLLQAWSNGVYKSALHRVVAHPRLERFSVAYFVCPSEDTVIQTQARPAIYRKFSFGEYRRQVQQDVKLKGHKIGLARFVAQEFQY